MEDDGIHPGIVEKRRKFYSPIKADMNMTKDKIDATSARVNASILSLNWRINQRDSDTAYIKDELITKGKIIEDLQVKVNLLQTLTSNLYQENQDIVSNMKEIRNELNSIQFRECVIHSDSVASIWNRTSS